MKKSVAIILFLVMLFSCTLLAACGTNGGTGEKDLSESRYVGTWKAVSMSLKDETGSFEDETLLILNADGTATFSSGDDVSKCTWEETGDGFKLKGDAKMKFTDDGDGIKSVVLGVTLHFERQQ